MASERTHLSRAKTLLVMGVVVVVILAVSYMANRPAAGGGLTLAGLSVGAAGPAPEVGKPAPNFTATTVEGAKVTLSGLRGRPVWLNFGAPWCQPCRAENPDIEAAYAKYRAQGLEVLWVVVNDSRSDIEGYATRTGLTYPMVDDSSGEVEARYRIDGIPSHFFIDRSGVLREIRISDLNPAMIEENLAEIGVHVAGSSR
jgi:cytochrome c biogenesis protein CcmG, thiol:disulfide interchange protein DsbE